MKSTDEVHEIALEKAKQFTETLDGRFRNYVSDVFLQAYLSQEFTDLYLKSKKEKPVQLAYNASCHLFETVLEHGCNSGCNGHHVAQEFCELFNDIVLE